MPDDRSELHAKPPARGLLRPGRFLWARALPWSLVLGIALWIAYKFAKSVGIDLGFGGCGVRTMRGGLAALALDGLRVRLVERRTPREHGLRRLAPELATSVVFGAAIFSIVMAGLLAAGAYALTGQTAAAPGRALTESLEGAVEELIFRGAIFRLFWSA